MGISRGTEGRQKSTGTERKEGGGRDEEGIGWEGGKLALGKDILGLE
jgi:hypothetical protein